MKNNRLYGDNLGININENKAGASRPQVGGVSGGGRNDETSINKGVNGNNRESESEGTYTVEKLVASHRNDAMAMEL